MSAYEVGEIIGLLLGLLFYGAIIAIIIFAVKKIRKNIRDKKRQKAWKESAAREAEKEEADRKAEEESKMI